MAVLFIFFALILQALIFLAHWFLYSTLVRFFGISNPSIIFSLKLALGILSVTFVSASLLANLSYNILVHAYYSFAAWWLGALFYLFLAACFVRLGAVLARSFSFPLDTKLLAEILFILALAVSIFGAINASFVRIMRLKIALPNLPQQWQGRSAVWVSDIHLGHVRNYDFAKNVAAMIRQLRPDIVFIGGDLYDGALLDLDKVTQPFANLGAPLGTYFITGNHEEFTKDTRFVDAVRRAGIKELDNEIINLEGLQIIGVNYRDTTNEKNYRTIMENFNIDQNQASILLKHSPYRAQIAQEAGINLQLSGHAHCGQFWPVGIISNLVFGGYAYGLKQSGNMTIYISSGTGTWGPPLRVLTTPEIVFIEFQ